MRNQSRSMWRVLGLAGLLLIVGGCASGGPTASDRATIDDVAWLAGMWIEEKPGGMTVETWSTPRPPRAAAGERWMVGLNVQTRDGAPVFHEYLRLVERDGGVIYEAAPRGREPATPFRLIERAPDRLVFENPHHNFPRRIVYELVKRPGRPAELHARIEGERNGRASSATWRFTRESP